MAQIQKGDTFTNGQQVDAIRLNQLVDSSVILVGAITEQPAMTPNTVTADDTTIIADNGTLKKVTAGSLFGSNIPVSTSSITGATGVDIIITPASGREVDIAGNFQVIGNDIVTGNSTVGGTLAVTGPASFNTNTAIKIPVGTTVQRPATPVAGQLRYNSTLDQAEVYSGTEWKAVGGSPFDASGGNVTTINGFRIHTFTISGTFTPSLNAEGKVEYLVVGGGGNGSGFNPHGGGGGGGDVKTGFLDITKNTAPMAVVVGTTGLASSFGGITASGGGSGSGYTGGASGSGWLGTNGNFGSGGGGGGGASGPSAYLNVGGGVGGEGQGSSISGTFQRYGGGGGGGGSTYGQSTNYPGLGIYGGGRGANSGSDASAPVANSGGGGGGGCGYNGRGASAGASGVVIIRYRVS